MRGRGSTLAAARATVWRAARNGDEGRDDGQCVKADDRAGGAAQPDPDRAAVALMGVARQRMPHGLPEPNPALVRHAQERARSLQNRVADRITAFAGSMTFVYVHVVWFGCWIAFGVEDYPFGLLTMIVSLEAIFLSTFVLISQNRADARRQLIADQQWQTVQQEEMQNEELLALSRQILDVLHARADRAPDVTGGGPTATRRDDGRRS